MPPALVATGVSKRFALATASTSTGFPTYRTLRERLSWPFSRRPRGGTATKALASEPFYALRDVSFEVQPGEIVGVIGRNGAGKSTLLKILSRITRPTAGEVLLRGRVGSLLEVGTSFHPELTGRENIALNGAILGMTRREVRARFDEIVAFSEVGPFLDIPVKRYSSGMFIRLAFAVAAHLEPEILLIDEVLAVGDAAFQKKCLGRMGGDAFRGRTVLFVSHNMAALQALCTRVIWLEGGRVREDGRPDEVVTAYLKTSFSPATERRFEDPATAPASDDIVLAHASVRPAGGRPADPISIRTPIVLEFGWWNRRPGAAMTVVAHVCDQHGTIVFRTASIKEPTWHDRPMPEGLFVSRCEIPGDLLNAGSHYLEFFVRRDEGLVVFRKDDLLTFEVLDDVEMRGACHGEWPGTVRPDLKWTTELVREGAPLPAPGGPA